VIAQAGTAGHSNPGRRARERLFLNAAPDKGIPVNGSNAHIRPDRESTVMFSRGSHSAS